MRRILDLDRFPLDRLDGVRGRELLARCRRELRDTGMFSLAGLIRPEALERCISEVRPLLGTAAFTHSREHNIYFDDDIEGLEASHPALGRFRTTNHTVCGDLIPSSLVTRIYEWQPLIDFLAATMDSRSSTRWRTLSLASTSWSTGRETRSTGTSTGRNSPRPASCRHRRRAAGSSTAAV